MRLDREMKLTGWLKTGARPPLLWLPKTHSEDTKLLLQQRLTDVSAWKVELEHSSLWWCFMHQRSSCVLKASDMRKAQRDHYLHCIASFSKSCSDGMPSCLSMPKTGWLASHFCGFRFILPRLVQLWTVKLAASKEIWPRAPPLSAETWCKSAIAATYCGMYIQVYVQ